MISELNKLKQHMHYVDFDAKTKQTIIRFAIYFILGLIAVGISFVVILAARGYDVDPKTGKVVRNGLVLLWSQPESVDVYVNGNLEDNTPARLPMPEGKYEIKMSKAGYRDWNKTVNLSPSEVIKLNYPRLFPNEIKAEKATTLAEVSEWLQSPNQEKVAVHSRPDATEILLYSMNDIQADPKIVTISKQELTTVNGAVGDINLLQWSVDSSYLLAEHINGETTEYIRVNIDDGGSVNINKAMNVALKKVQFDRSENGIFYGLSQGGLLRRVDLRKKTVSEALIGEVIDFRIASDGRVLALQQRAKTSSLVMLNDDDEIETILSEPKTTTGQLELGTFEDKDYAVVSLNPKETQLVWLDIPAGDNDRLVTTFTGKNMEVYPVSFTSRFALASSGETLSVYDFEKLKTFEFKFKDVNPKNLSWFDDGHLISTTTNGQINVVEFDGKNLTNIGEGSNYRAYTDKDFNVFFSLAKNKDGKLDLNVSNLRPQ